LSSVNVFAQLADHVLVVFVFIKSLQHLLLHFLSITDEWLQWVKWALSLRAFTSWSIVWFIVNSRGFLLDEHHFCRFLKLFSHICFYI
jgi:hypothetical protein